MGYKTSASGVITISPPLKWGDVSGSPYLPERVNRDGNWREIQYVGEMTERWTDDDQIITRVVTGIEPVNPGEPMKRYDLLIQVQDVIDHHPGHTFAGHFEMHGEEAGDIARIVVRDGRAENIRPTLVWPDDTVVAE